MNLQLLSLFIILNIVNVMLQTFKSIATIKYGKWISAIVNAVAYGLYTVLLVYMNCDLQLWAKVLVVGGANLIGVFVIKAIEEKTRKDKLWKIEVTIPTDKYIEVDERLRAIPHSYIYISTKHTLFNFYCATQAESQQVKDIVNEYGAKYFVAESKIL